MLFESLLAILAAKATARGRFTFSIFLPAMP
jgi:hypothetical protein